MGGRRDSMYTLEEVGKIKFTAVICGSKDTEGGETWLSVEVVRKSKVTNQYVCGKEKEKSE